MTILKLFIALLTTSLLTSCSGTFRLSEEEHDWMPYKGNETLVFTSTNGDTDTIVFFKKDTLFAYPEAQALNGKTYEVVSIFAKYSSGTSNDFVELQKSKDKKARLHFDLSTKDANFYRLTGIRIDSLAKQPFTSIATKHKTYNDVYVIYDKDWLNFKQRSNYLTKLYRSKSEGLIRYDKLTTSKCPCMTIYAAGTIINNHQNNQSKTNHRHECNHTGKIKSHEAFGHAPGL